MFEIYELIMYKTAGLSRLAIIQVTRQRCCFEENIFNCYFYDKVHQVLVYERDIFLGNHM